MGAAFAKDLPLMADQLALHCDCPDASRFTDFRTEFPKDLPQDAAAAFARYEAVRPRLPQASFPRQSQHAASLSAVAERWDGFILDAYGVLNVGETAIPGAVARMAELRAMGKKLCVLTNGAGAPQAVALAKYHRLGFDFTADEVVSSRDVAVAQLDSIAAGAHWGAITGPLDDFHDMPQKVSDLIRSDVWDQVDGFLFLSATRWTPALRQRLYRAMRDRPRPLVVANPDLVAPNERAFSIEPGFWAHELLDALALPNHWFGKPFTAGLLAAAARTGLDPARLAMVGDTLHTDILGGSAAGMGTVLVAGHGLFAGHDPAPFIARSGIVPDAVVATT